MNPIYLGIDLGSNFSRVGFITPNHEPFILSLGHNNSGLPSIIFFPHIEQSDQPDQFLIGTEAQEAILQEPDRGALLFKRRMGDNDWYLEIDHYQYTAQKLSQILLHYIQNVARSEINNPISGCVITIPAYYSESAKQDTLQAAQEAGLNLLGLLYEPTAAALAYGYLYHAPQICTDTIHLSSVSNLDDVTDLSLIFDLGGGTLDLSLVKLNKGQIYPLAYEGDMQLGCQDWDDAIACHVAAEFEEQYGWSPLEYPNAFESLRQICKKTREELSQRTEVILEFCYINYKYKRTWDKLFLEQICSPLLQRCRNLIEKLLIDSKISQVKEVILVGGGSRMPMIHNLIQSIFGFPANTKLDPANAIALGAAIYANQLGSLPINQRCSDADRFISGLVAKQYTQYSLQLLIANKNGWDCKLLFESHTHLPAHTTLRGITTMQNQQTEIDILLIQDDKSVTSSITLPNIISIYRISKIPPKSAGWVDIKISIHCNYKDDIKISAIEYKTSNQLEVNNISYEMYCSTTIKPSRDIMLLIDTSASMEGRPILEVKYAVSQFLQTIEFSNLDNQRIGLISFGHQGVKRHLPLQRDITLLQGHIAQFNTGGTTALDTALQLALDTFRENPVEADERIIFILSDGHPNQPDKAKTIAMQIKQQDIRIITIGIGTKINSEYLSTIISSCANDYHSIDDPLELRTTFAAIAHTLYPAVIQT